MPTPPLPTYFISHGGGPWPWLDGEYRARYRQLEASLADMPRQVGRRPDAVLMISGHWEEPAFTVQTHPRPPMVYDYYGFPEHTYRIQYPAPGSPALAERVHGLLGDAGFEVRRDPERGYDHGVFSPMVAIYPDASVPVVQLSMREGYDPAEHVAAGRALAPLRNENVLIVGSGLSYHNLRLFGPGARLPSKAFDDWLQAVLAQADPQGRVDALGRWSQAPAARIAHPREDHLIPLMVALGAAEHEAAHCVYHEEDFVGGVTASSWRFGDAAGA